MSLLASRDVVSLESKACNIVRRVLQHLVFVSLGLECVALYTRALVPSITHHYAEVPRATAINFRFLGHHQPRHHGEVQEESPDHVGAKRISSLTNALGDSGVRKRLAVTNAAAQHLKTKIPQSQWLEWVGMSGKTPWHQRACGSEFAVWSFAVCWLGAKCV